jgi:expansin (peptidoglycan-binding protein)
MIADYIDLTNNLLKKHKKLVKKNLATPAKKGSPWWNEILIYNAKIKEIFVMSREAKKDLEWDGPQKASLEKLISITTGDDPITIGTPAKYRKWYTDRKGVFDD